jgi:hypothetical protein
MIIIIINMLVRKEVGYGSNVIEEGKSIHFGKGRESEYGFHPTK